MSFVKENDKWISIPIEKLNKMEATIEDQKLKINELEKLNAYLVGYIEGIENDKQSI